MFGLDLSWWSMTRAPEQLGHGPASGGEDCCGRVVRLIACQMVRVRSVMERGPMQDGERVMNESRQRII